MRILAKFNLVLMLVFTAAVSITGYIAREFLQQDARNEVLQQAQLLVGAAGAMRTYTTDQLDPLLEAHQAHSTTFYAQTIPFFGATEVFNYLRKTYPAYTYKEATLNPTNPRDRAADWEADVIQGFRNHSDETQMMGQRDTPEGESLWLAHPIKVEASCLECHSSPSTAPAALVKVYGRDNGFNWKMGDIVGAQIVSVPMSLPIKIADREFKALMVSLGSVFLVTLVLLDAALIVLVVRPVSRLSRMADEISKGNLQVPEIPAKGSDEIAQLARSFNRMYVSLAKAIKLLESQ
jgi:HAMP domain-containing protein